MDNSKVAGTNNNHVIAVDKVEEPEDGTNLGNRLRDTFTWVVGLRWRYLLLLFAASFPTSWLGFAAIWHLSFWTHLLKIHY